MSVHDSYLATLLREDGGQNRYSSASMHAAFSLLFSPLNHICPRTRPLDSFKLANRLQFKALRTDSRIGLTFATLASGAAGTEKRIRNQANARKAYDAVLSGSRKMSLSEDERQELTAGLDKLRSALGVLGEQLRDDVAV